ncbi:hypothetical protein T265_05599 [Opisthorchis viverrini]|uniref:Uncharacterized protein n=1 Tax=Opisthorchis viverrini TaxID=6198 RepID=A0A075AF46_OPIVI|nr:hypothetical protein T265_05599 [Opisthorchis viverrini]KER27354.1 hypothetical protein T265_05599 [Opisthorchis viverrini]
MPLLGTKKSRIVMTCLAGLPVTLRSNQLINGLRQEHILLTITEVTLQGLELRLTVAENSSAAQGRFHYSTGSSGRHSPTVSIGFTFHLNSNWALIVRYTHLQSNLILARNLIKPKLNLSFMGRRLDRLAQTTDTGQARTSSVLTASSEFSVCAVLRFPVRMSLARSSK